MVMTDPVADLLTRVRNAARAGHKQVTVNHSKFKEAIVKLLVEEGYLGSYAVVESGRHRAIQVDLKYTAAGKPAFHGIERVSKPGLRIYVRRDRIPYVMNGLGVAVLSTSRGVLPDYTARREGLGGELICRVW
ncbi:30S ribosomal protein S8 [bacterium]|nr:30S ribosomal protein S8 [bacterium]